MTESPEPAAVDMWEVARRRLTLILLAVQTLAIVAGGGAMYARVSTGLEANSEAIYEVKEEIREMRKFDARMAAIEQRVANNDRRLERVERGP